MKAATIAATMAATTYCLDFSALRDESTAIMNLAQTELKDLEIWLGYGGAEAELS